MDVADPTMAAANANLGLKKRYVFSQESGILEMAGPLFCDVFRSERLLLSFVDLKVILNRNVNEFCLMASEGNVDYRVKLTKAYLKIRKVKVSLSISIAHELALKKGPAIYLVRCVECKTFIIAAGNPSLRKDNLYNGLVPKTFVFGMIDSAAFNGAYKKILTTLKPIPPRSLASRPTEKKCLPNPYGFPRQPQIPDASRRTSPCSQALESYFPISGSPYHAMISRMVMPCMLPT